VRNELYRAAGSILSRIASIGDTLTHYTKDLAEACVKASLRQGRAVECPYCQEHIRTAEDHVMWCDVVDTLRNPLSNPDTSWPVVRYGIGISHELAMALTRKS
jgi:hypothetical protein